MFAVRIPNEIRAYKEKLAFGLTLRQLIASVIALVICVPLYVWGRKYLGDDVVSWIVIAVAIPVGGFGFIKVNGMTFEKFVMAVVKTLVILPQRRKFKSINFFKEIEDKETSEELIGINSKKLKKYKEQASLERTYLLEMAEQNGEVANMEEIENNLLTVRKPTPKNGGKKNNDKEDKKKVKSKSRTQIKAEAIEAKKQNDPTYIPTKKEGKILKAYAEEIKKERLAQFNSGKKQVQKKSRAMAKRRTAKSNLPKSTQDTLPYIADYDEGLFEVEPNKYSKCFVLMDINYLVAREEEQIDIFEKWGEFLNYFSDDMSISLCIDNRIVSMNEQEQKVYYKLKGDDYDVHRTEYNKILRKQIIAGKNDIQQMKYITVTIDCDNVYEALLKFHRIEQEVITNLRAIGSNGRVMTTEERLELLHDKFRHGKEGDFGILLNDFREKGEDFFEFIKKQGLSSKDYIAPSSFLFKSKDWFCIEDRYCRCLYLNSLPASLAMDNFNNMIDVEFPLMTTLHIQPIAKDKGLRLIKKQLTGMEANKIEAEKKAIRSGYSPETINHDLRQALAQAEEMLDDCVNKNQKMFYVTIGFMVMGDTMEELEDNCKVLISKARQFTCQIQSFDYQQEDAFNVIMPMGISPRNKLYVERCLTTESTAIFTPFASQELFQEGGFYYGLNQISLNLILCNRTAMKTPSGFLLGSSGSGKSFATKREMLNVLLNDDKTGVLVIDPENEYGDFAKAFGGVVLNLTASSECFINPMDMDENYGLDDNDDPLTVPMQRKKEKALQKKAEYLMSIIHFMITENDVSSIKPQQKSLIDRAIKRTYETYLDHDFDPNFMPTLLDLQNELDKEKIREDGKINEDGRVIAESVEYYTRGSMNLFSHHSNLDFTNRFVVFNIRDLGKELKQISLLIVLDFIWNRMIANCQQKIRTYCYVDEIHVLFQNDFSARYLQQLYKRGRKYGLVITGITQDVSDLLTSDMAKGMLYNSDFILMLNQNGDNLKQLAKLLGISEAQCQFITKAEAGSGLLFAEKTIVPFVDRFPENSYLYTLMSTKFGEDNDIDIKAFIEKLRKQQKEREEQEQKEIAKQIEKVG